jgi:hypothetical protein
MRERERERGREGEIDGHNTHKRITIPLPGLPAFGKRGLEALARNPEKVDVHERVDADGLGVLADICEGGMQ